MAYDEESVPCRIADGHEPVLFVRMIWVIKRRGQRIIEYSHGSVERNAVLLEVLRRFASVLLEPHRTIVASVPTVGRLTPAVSGRGEQRELRTAEAWS
jgi:hypothetical protein